MSRKREHQREQRRELERQLGGGDVPDDVRADLQSHARVCEPEWKAALTIHDVKRGLLGLLQAKSPLALHVALFVVDASGARLARVERARGALAKGSVALEVVERAGPEKVRYTRPGRFVVVALAAEGADGDARALADPALTFVVDGASHAPADPALAKERFETARAARFPFADDARAAGVVLVIPAVHRVKDTVELPLASASFRATLALELRL